MTKKIFGIMLALSFVFVLFCSCENSTQMRDRAIIEAMAIDFEDGKYVVTLKEYLPSETAEKDASDEKAFIKSSGETLFDALKNAESNDGKQVFYGHSGVFVIGKGAAEQGMDQIFEFMNSNYQLSLNSSVLFSQDNAHKIIMSEEFLGANADFSIRRIQDCGKSLDVTVIDALKMSHNLEKHLYLPTISINKESGLKIENCAIFKDNRPIDILSTDETMGLNLMLGNVKDGVFISKQNNQRISVNIVSQKSDISIDTNGNEIILKVLVSVYGNVSEFGVIGDEEERKNLLKNVTQDIESQIKQTVLKTLNKTVNEKYCDILYVKQSIKNEDEILFKYIDENGIEEAFKKAKFDVDAEFTIRHSGIQVK